MKLKVAIGLNYGFLLQMTISELNMIYEQCLIHHGTECESTCFTIINTTDLNIGK
jgi:hypothetical protein